MSLNWDATKLPAERLTYRYCDSDGKQQEQQCPKLHRFIWLTLSINRDMTGGEKAQAEFIKRFLSLGIIKPTLLEIEAGIGNLKGNEEYWKGHVPSRDGKRFTYTLTVEDVKAYWGLNTNVWGRERYSKWLVRQMEHSLRGY